jgi:hypothetical protein
MLLNAGMSSLALQQSGQDVSGTIPAAITQQDKGGTIADLFREPVIFSLNAGDSKAILQSGLTFGKTSRLKENAATLRAIVPERLPGAVGPPLAPAAPGSSQRLHP